jgi:hypothetical protein
MTFVCNEDYSKMPCTDGGRFCNSCSKSIHDFTDLSIAEIRRLKETDPEICGIFMVEQVDPNLKELKFPYKNRVAIWASTLFMAFGSADTFAQSGHDPKVEQSQGSSNAPKLSGQEIESNMNQGKHISLSRSAPEANETTEYNPRKARRAYKRMHRRVYVNKRFPFIHIRRRYRMGKF